MVRCLAVCWRDDSGGGIIRAAGPPGYGSLMSRTAVIPPRPARQLTLSRVLATVVVAAVVLVGCGDDESKASSGKDTNDSSVVEKKGTAKTTTTSEALDETTTTEAATDTTDTTETTVAGGEAIPTPPVIDPNVVVPSDTDAGPTGWNGDLTTLRGQNGTKVRFTCEPNGQISTVWGSNPYTDDSSVCTAAVHSGLFTVESGGSVVVQIAPGQPTYLGTVAFAVTTLDYGSWSGSFVVLGRG